MDRKDLIKDVQRGDILLMSNNSFLGRAIQKITKSVYSHAEIYIGGGDCVGATNKMGWGVRVRPLSWNIKRFYRIDIFRYPNLSSDKAEKLCQQALNHVGEGYNIWLLLLFPINFLLPDKWKNPLASKHAEICSQLVTKSYKEVGIDVIPHKAESQESPADIGRAKTLRWIGAYKGGWKIKGCKRGKEC